MADFATDELRVELEALRTRVDEMDTIESLPNPFEVDEALVGVREQLDALEQNPPRQILDPLFRFGISVLGAVVTIHPGSVQVGTNAFVDIAEQTRTITQDAQYIAVEYTDATKTAVVGNPTTSKPVSTPTVFKQWLCRFSFASGLAAIDQIGWSGGDIIIPARYGD